MCLLGVWRQPALCQQGACVARAAKVSKSVPRPTLKRNFTLTRLEFFDCGPESSQGRARWQLLTNFRSSPSLPLCPSLGASSHDVQTNVEIFVPVGRDKIRSACAAGAETLVVLGPDNFFYSRQILVACSLLRESDTSRNPPPLFLSLSLLCVLIFISPPHRISLAKLWTLVALERYKTDSLSLASFSLSLTCSHTPWWQFCPFFLSAFLASFLTVVERRSCAPYHRNNFSAHDRRYTETTVA